MRSILSAVFGLVVLGVTAGAAGASEKVAADKLPGPVAEAVKKRFPKAEVKGGSKSTTDGKVTFEVTLKEDGKNIDVSTDADGVISQIEKEVAMKDLPKSVAEAFETRHPKAKYKIIEAVIKVTGGKESLDYYEAVVTTVEGKIFEVEIKPDGKFKGESEKKPK